MSKKRIQFQPLISEAQKEASPSIDVVCDVSRRIAPISTTPPKVELSLLGAAGLSIAASALVMFFLFQQQTEFDTALADWLQPLIVVMR